MSKEEKGRLRVHGQGSVEVSLIRTYLEDIEHSYNAIVAFEALIDSAQRISGRYPEPFIFDPLLLGAPLLSRRLLAALRTWPPSPVELAYAVSHRDRLLIRGVRLSSPGFWDFLGKLNPLEVIRQYLNDRHERRKDRDYRESAEERRLRLENLERENRVLRERIEIARSLGATDRDLAPWLNTLVFHPLQTLDRHQDRYIIEHAKIYQYEDSPK